MIVLDVELLVKCREYGLDTIHEINEFAKKYDINSNDELEKVLDGELAVFTLTAVEENKN